MNSSLKLPALTVSPSIAAFAVGSIAFLVAFRFFGVAGFQKFPDQIYDVEVLRAELGSIRVSTTSETFIAQVADLKRQAEVLLPAKSRPEDLLLQVEALARASGVTIETLSVATVPADVDELPEVEAAPVATGAVSADGTRVVQQAPPVALQKLSLSVSATGSYGRLQVFTQGLTSLERIVEIDQLSLTNSEEGGLQLAITAGALLIPEASAQ